MNWTFRIPILALLGFAVSLPISGQDSNSEGRLRQEERLDYFQKWLKEDVVYLITDDERAVFESLQTDEEREQFIEQFWFRRDPNPVSAENEYKTEHYRRIAFANERFASGLPGWMTDRGRIYILHGPPAEIERHPTGGPYNRPFHEGGGSTYTYPFEIWRYRHLPGVGEDIVLEFVDASMSGEYRLALMPEEKDALLHVAGGGQTLAEEFGLAAKADRPFFSPANRDSYPMMFQRARDNPFARYETYSRVQRPVEIKYKDLQEIVKVDVGYASLPMEVRRDYFRLSGDQVLVPITVQVRNADLTFNDEGTARTARVAVYGLVTSITNRVVTEFEDDLVRSCRPDDCGSLQDEQSVYQKVVVLDGKLRYKLNLVLKDLHSEKVGSLQSALVPPAFGKDEMMASSLILADDLRWFRRVPEESEMFLLGDVKVRPNVSRRFTDQMELGMYFQLYNAALDQSTYEPSLRVSYQLYGSGSLLNELTEDQGESVQYASDERVVVIKALSLEGLEPALYEVRVTVEDRLSGRQVVLSEKFEIVQSRSLTPSP